MRRALLALLFLCPPVYADTVVGDLSGGTTVYGDTIDTGNATVYSEPLGANVALWLDADDDSTITSSGGNVTAWADKGSGELSFTSLANPPKDDTILVNGASKRAVEFDDANTETLYNASSPVADTEGTTWFVVATSDDETDSMSAFSIVDQDNSGGDSDLAEIQFRGDQASDPIWLQVQGSGGAGSASVGPEDFAADEAYVLVAKLASATSRICRNDGTDGAAQTASRTTTNVDRTGIGYRAFASPGFYHSGKIMEVIVVDRVLDDDEIAIYEDYLWRKWVYDPGKGNSFTPDLLTGLQCWVDFSDSSTLTTSGSEITVATDKSDNGYSFVPETTGPDTTTVTLASGDTRAAAIFDDANSEALYVNSAPVTAPPMTVFAAFMTDTSAANGCVFYTGDKDVTGHRWVLGARTTQKVRFEATATNTKSSDSTDTYDLNEMVIGHGRTASTTSRFGSCAGIDGTENTETQAPANADRIAIGGRLTSSPLNYLSGTVGEVIFYDRILTDKEVYEVLAYLERRWRSGLSHPASPGIPAVGLVGDFVPDSTVTNKTVDEVHVWQNVSNKGSLAGVDQATSANRPVRTASAMNSLTALTFAGGDSEYMDASTPVISGPPFTVLAAAEADDITNFHTVLSIDGNSPVDYWNLMLAGGATGDPARFRSWDGTGANADSSSAYSANTEHVIGGKEVSTTSRFAWLDGTQGSDPGGTIVPTSMSTTTIGDTIGVWYMYGNIARILVYKRDLSDAEYAKASAALSDTWVP